MAERRTVHATCMRAARPWLSFRAINRKDRPGYDPSLQRHHLLPRQLLSRRCFGRMFDTIGLRRSAFDNFRANGLLLPATEEGAIRLGLPLHRGPHRDYSAMVIERVGCIEQGWAQRCGHDPQSAIEEALQGLALLQSRLREQLLAERNRLRLNRKDPLGTGFDFSELDAMAETLWQAT